MLARPKIVAIGAVLLSIASLVLGPPQDPQDRKTAPYDRQGKLVRDAGVCADCHEEEAAAIAAGVHARVPQSKLLDACETCHGPGELHVEENEAGQITHPPLLTAAKQRALCGRCHREELQDHGGPLDELLAAGKKCTSCHKVHETHADVPGAKDRRDFHSRADVDSAAEPVGMAKCLECHKDKAASLESATHAPLLRARGLGRPGFEEWDRETSCEACHGNGSLHVATGGLARLISRPDAATDGIASCRRCHGHVDPERFHWKDADHDPLLGGPGGRKLTCTTCHKVHHGLDPALAAPPKPAPRPTSRPARPSPKVDTSLDATVAPGACLDCHAPAYQVLHGTIHASLARLDQPAGTGCVSCHPGAGQHAARGGQKDLVVSLRGTSAAFQKRLCMDCHGKDSKPGNAALCGYTLGVHGRQKVECLTCHSPAAPKAPRLMKQDAHKACASCHGDVALSFRHANRHPIGEAAFTCSSCHDPHDPKPHGPNLGRKMSRTCVECHREYKGPFVFPHHADKGRGCLACHVPHGSSNRKLLDKRRVRDNCLSCHADLPAFHDQSIGSQYRNCLDCHTQIHGSNRNRFFFR